MTAMEWAAIWTVFWMGIIAYLVVSYIRHRFNNKHKEGK